MPEERLSASPPGRSSVSIAHGVIVVVVYIATIIIVRLIGDVEPDALDVTSGNAVKSVLLPVACAVTITLILTTALGWYRREVVYERPDRRLIEPKWAWAVPILLALTIAGGLVATPWGDFESSVLLVLLAGCLLVGIGEELTVRGYLLAAARGRYTEVGAWFFSTFLFAILHFSHVVTGTAVGSTITQVIFAFLSGSSVYLIRRLTGSLFAGMLLHGLFDYSVFLSNGVGEGGAADGTPALTLLPLILTWIVTIAVLVVVFRRSRAHEPVPAT